MKSKSLIRSQTDFPERRKNCRGEFFSFSNVLGGVFIKRKTYTKENRYLSYIKFLDFTSWRLERLPKIYHLRNMSFAITLVRIFLISVYNILPSSAESEETLIDIYFLVVYLV